MPNPKYSYAHQMDMRRIFRPRPMTFNQIMEILPAGKIFYKENDKYWISNKDGTDKRSVRYSNYEL